jgi:Zn finger protein HypA/HybF involved in hydrogenase expression
MSSTLKSLKPVFKRRNSTTLKKGHSIQVNINPTLQKCEHCPAVVKKTQIVFPPAPSRQTQSAVWTSTGAIIITSPHPVPRATTKCPTSLCVSHEQCKEGKTQQNSETRVFLRVHTFLSIGVQCPLCNSRGKRLFITERKGNIHWNVPSRIEAS